jgi:molybdopterin synthase catalytic subunit
MAASQMQGLAAEARRRWPVERLVMVHRVGRVAVGGVSVWIGVACGHREEAFEACRYLIDRLKKEVPIWKREVWGSGASTWVDPSKGCCS